MGDYFLTVINGQVVIARRIKDYCGGRVLRLDYLVSHVEIYRDSCKNLREIVGPNPDPLNMQIIDSVERVFKARTLTQRKSKRQYNRAERKLDYAQAHLMNGALCPKAASEIDAALVNLRYYRQDPIVYSQISVPFLHHIAEALQIFNGVFL